MSDTLPSTTDIQIAADSSFSNILINDNVAYCTSRSFAADALPYGTNLYARVRHHHPETGTSNWSASSHFCIQIPEEIIGVCVDYSTTKGVFYWIDGMGNKKESFDRTKYAVYSNISMATIDDRAPVTMTKIPLFYIKTAASGPVGSFAAGKKCWWIANYHADGFHPAACFKRTTTQDADGKYVISPCCYIGTYLGHFEDIGGTTTIGSKKGSEAATYETKSSFTNYINQRNAPSLGLAGFRMFDIWDMGALRLLALIAKANANLQSAFGDNTTGEYYPRTGTANARVIFKGTTAEPQVSIDDLWRCYWYFVDLIAVNKGTVALTSPMDRQTSISFGSALASRYKQTTTSGWLKDVLDCPMVIGDDTHDLMELFLPKTTNSSESRGTFFDYHDASTSSSTQEVVAGGCSWSTRGIPVSGSGLFRTQFFSMLYTETLVEGVRICKN